MEYFLSQIMETPPTYLSEKSYHDQRIIGATRVCFLALYHGAPVYSYLIEVFRSWYQNSFHPSILKEGLVQEEWRQIFLREQSKMQTEEHISFLLGLFCNNQFFLFRTGTCSAFVLSEHIRWITHTSPTTLQNWEFYTGHLQENQWFFLGSECFKLTPGEEAVLTAHWPSMENRALEAFIHKKYSNQNVYIVRVQEEKGVEFYGEGRKGIGSRSYYPV